MKWLISIIIVSLLIMPIVLAESGTMTDQEYQKFKEQKAFNMQNLTIENSIENLGEIPSPNWIDKIMERLNTWYLRAMLKFQ